MMNMDVVYGLTPQQARHLAEMCDAATKPFLKGSMPAPQIIGIERAVSAQINLGPYKLPKVTALAHYLPADRHVELFFVWADKPHYAPANKGDRYLGTMWWEQMPLDLFISREMIPFLYLVDAERKGVMGRMDYVVDHMIKVRSRVELNQSPAALFCAARIAIKKRGN